MNDTETFTCKTGKLYLVDLAGSECISKTGATGTTLEEAKMINKSLTMLGRVINALTDGKSQYVPYRDSKLTRMLKDALGGNSKTCLIITLSPAGFNSQETLSSCRFGMRAKIIRNNAKINKQISVAELKYENEKLEMELQLKLQKISQLELLLKNFPAENDTPESKIDGESPAQKNLTAKKQIDDITNIRKLKELEEQKQTHQRDIDAIMEQLVFERKKHKMNSEKIRNLQTNIKELQSANENSQRECEEYKLRITVLEEQIADLVNYCRLNTMIGRTTRKRKGN
jgi:kinesin family protein 5